MSPKVDVFRNSEFSFNAFHASLENFSLLSKLESAQRIGIKPNLCAGSICTSESGVVTNKEVLSLICSFIRRINPNARLLIFESDSTGCGYTFLKFERQGYHELAKEFSAELIDLSRGQLTNIMPEKPQHFKKGIWLSKDLLDLDFFISLAKIKTHNITTISCCLKNLFGCLADSDKSIYHWAINEVIGDLNSVIKTDLCICEGVPALEGNGPVMGVARALDTIVMANDPVACDTFIAKLTGFDQSRIRHIRLAAQRGLGERDLSKITIRGFDGACCELKSISKEQKFFLHFGLLIQRIGQGITHFGHLLHLQQSVSQIIRGILRRLSRWG